MSDGAKVLKFPDRKPPSDGALVGAGHRRVACPMCRTNLQPFRGHWTKGRSWDHYWLCSWCGGIFGPPPRPVELGATIDTVTGGLPGAKVTALADAAEERRPFTYEAWVTDDGLVRVTDGRTEHRSLGNAVTISAEQARKIADDFMALSRAAEEQQERLRGDDKWHVRPHPERTNVFLVKQHLHGNRYTERAFVQTEFRKPRRCEVCYGTTEAGGIMWREENPKAWAHPNWREIRICSSCIRGGK